MKDGTKVSIIYMLALIPTILSLLWVFSLVALIYYSSDMFLALSALFISMAFAIVFSYFEPHTRHWRKAYCEFDDNYTYEKGSE